MYTRTHWVDHVVDTDGKVLQEGTPLDQQHMNNIEEGIVGVESRAEALEQAQLVPVGATFTIDGWVANAGVYSQTKTQAVACGAFVPAKVWPPMSTATTSAATKNAKAEALSIIDSGTVEITVTDTLATMTVKTEVMPTCDVDVVWYLER